MKKLSKIFSLCGLAVFALACQPSLPEVAMELSLQSVEFTCDGGSESVSIKSNRDWQASTDADWLSVSPAEGEALDAWSYITVTAQSNGDLPREAVISIAAKTGEMTLLLTVSQGEDEYVIKTAQQLTSCLEDLATAETQRNYRIGRDIDLKGVTLPQVPVLNATFDGQGHSLSNLQLDKSIFVDISETGAVKNLVLDSSCSLVITGKDENFGFIAQTSAGTLEGIVNKAAIRIDSLSKGYKSAICGVCTGDVISCGNEGNVTFEGLPEHTGTMYFGGVIGRMNLADKSVSLSYNTGDISFKVNGTISQSLYIAGICGAVNNNGKAISCTNEGSVSLRLQGSETNAHVAGIVTYAGGEVSSCVNKGDILLRSESAEGKADGPVKGTGVAGIADYIGWSGGTVSYNVNYGSVTLAAGYSVGYQTVGSAKKYSSNVAGVFAHVYNCEVQSCDNHGAVSSTFTAIDKCPDAGYNTAARQSLGGVISSGWGTVDSCRNYGKVTADWRTSTHDATLAKVFVTMVGGVVGGDYHSDQISTVITNCTNEGDVDITCDSSGANNAFGGIVGWPTKEATTGKSVENCINKGNISLSGYSKSRMGGISGGAATLVSNKNYGKVEFLGGLGTCAVGGIVGFMNYLNITDCESYGDVVSSVKLTGAQSSAAGAAGGLAGAIGNTAMVYAGCKINCKVSAPDGSTMAMLVGSIGHDKANAKTLALGTETAPIYVKGTLGSTELTASNYSDYITASNYSAKNGDAANSGITFNVKYLE